ncbi:gnat family acetyltransferase [Lecanosticta acicola]|uniref:Gnat family acetyltransferase n=1 Tax=Lecanosticta acicola TaxID=111012 RepID=A0AAI8Z579_9PEZI|nr:gnat family acetyltransferase [Lecanosticta acicola]
MAPVARELGPEVPSTPAALPNNSHTLQSRHVTLEGLHESHIPSLWRNLRLWENGHLLDYLPMLVPQSEDELWQRLSKMSTERGFVLYAIKADPSQVNAGSKGERNHTEVLGVIAYLNIVPENREIEVGGVLFGPALQRSAAATEVHYLVLRNVSEPDSPGLGGSSLPYRRIVWKCDRLNHRSRRAAERLGYVFEGRFRKHWIVKGRSRDSDFLSIVDDEWPVVKAALEQWLDDGNFDAEGRQVRRLDGIREELSRSTAEA